MKRVLVIGLTEKMGGVETFIYNTTIFSDRTKYEYDFLVHGSKECVFENEINEFYGDKTHIHYIRNYKKSPLGCLRDLAHFYKENGAKYDIIHLETGSTAEVLYVFPFYKKYNIKVISHSHNGNGKSPFINSLFRPIVNAISDVRLSCSNVASQWLFGNKHVDDTIVINNGVDVQKFTYSEEWRKEIREKHGIQDEYVIGHIGRFSNQKNHVFLIDIFEQVIKFQPNAKLILVGVGEKEDEIKSICRAKGICDNVIFAGKQMDAYKYYCAFDSFLMPSLYEGLPVVGIEAQCEGLPCFFSDTIDSQIKITDLAHIHSLNDTPFVWAQDIIEYGKCEARDRYPTVIDKMNYSIQGVVNQLSNIYDHL